MSILLVLARRVRDIILVLFVVGTILFFIVRLVPGDPAIALVGDSATPEQLEQVREAMGLNGPIWQQYLTWFANVVQGDFGTSIRYHEPVLGLLLERLPTTLALAVFSIAISFFLAVFITVWNAAKPRSWIARFIANAAPMGLSIPNFWIALLMVWLFAVQLKWVPPSGYAPIWEDPAASVRYLILPVATLCIGQTAQFVLVLRESISGELTHLYLRSARSKGLGEFRVLLKHVMPNAMLPIITVLGLDFALLIGGVVIIERVFAIPGLGTMMINAIDQRDYPLIQGGALLIALLFVLINLIVDVLYAVLDPKVRVR